MTVTTEDEALRQLQKEQSKLLDKIDELRTIGVGGLVELPQLIVCGNQSSGKSSVLEAISRVKFPAKSNVCTRFATEVILRRSPKPKIKISIEPGPSRLLPETINHIRSFTHEEFSDGDGLPALIEKAKEHMGIEDTVNSGFSDDILKVEVSGPEKPELTLVDLPGLYYSTSLDQGKRGIAIVRGLTEKYMTNSRSIILAVVSAKTDYHLQEVVNMAEKFDKRRERTLGIITQPDMLEVNSEEEESYLKFMRNEKTYLKLGWHALRNRSFETRNISDDARDDQEREFFNQGNWSSIPRDSVGVESLRRRLSSILLKHIQQNLPELIADMKKKIADREERMSKLGSPRSTLQQQRGFLLNVSSAFERIVGQALNGMYADEFFGGLGTQHDQNNSRLLRAAIRQLNEFFAEAMTIRGGRRAIIGSIPWPSTKANPYLADWAPQFVSREKLEGEATELARQNRGIELPGSANQLLVGNLFRDQSKPWEGLGRDHLLKAWDSVRYFVFLLLQHLTDEHTSALLAGSVIEPELEGMKQALLDKLDELTTHTKRGHPLPVGKSFLTQIQKARSDRLVSSLKSKLANTSTDNSGPLSKVSVFDVQVAIAELEKSRDEFAAADIVDQMQAYYDIAILTFVDNVATLGIENCLLAPLQRIFSSQVVNNMDDAQIRELAAEPLYVTEERNRLSQELEKLQVGLRTFNIFRPIVPPFTSSSEPKNRSIFETAAPPHSPKPPGSGLFSHPSIPSTTSPAAPSTATSTNSDTAPKTLFGRPVANPNINVSSNNSSIFGNSKSSPLSKSAGMFGQPTPGPSLFATGSHLFGGGSDGPDKVTPLSTPPVTEPERSASGGSSLPLPEGLEIPRESSSGSLFQTFDKFTANPKGGLFAPPSTKRASS
ncbi:P-loop containing nucleoside triphosphate hydrolase protein [Aspergillus pseudodeflectus]|uniref:P-loop containing nucleoside triphosphate hydrolase protein n=1 Tax=Aspergillus pseudodeflectus TaxID=176178 RepID=A0ABR4JTV8_9EURO